MLPDAVAIGAVCSGVAIGVAIATLDTKLRTRRRRRAPDPSDVEELAVALYEAWVIVMRGHAVYEPRWFALHSDIKALFYKCATALIEAQANDQTGVTP